MTLNVFGQLFTIFLIVSVGPACILYLSTKKII